MIIASFIHSSREAKLGAEAEKNENKIICSKVIKNSSFLLANKIMGKEQEEDEE